MVAVILGVLTAFGVPRLMRAVEKSKASEAFKYLTSVRDAQERYALREGEYAAVDRPIGLSPGRANPFRAAADRRG